MGYGAVMSTHSGRRGTVGMVADLPQMALLAVTIAKIHFYYFSDYQAGGTYKILSFFKKIMV